MSGRSPVQSLAAGTNPDLGEPEMDVISYHAAVVAELSKLPGWTEHQAHNFSGCPGDVEDAWADGLTPADCVSELLHAAST